jgi:hypothetical protein
MVNSLLSSRLYDNNDFYKAFEKELKRKLSYQKLTDFMILIASFH